MDLDSTTLERLGAHVIEADSYEPGPMALAAAIAYLSGDADLEASVCRMQASDGVVRWAVVWIAGPLVGVAQVTKAASDWDGHSPDQKPDDSEAWVRRLDQIVQLGAHSLNFESLGPFGRRWESSMSPMVQWADGSELRLPIFGKTPKARERVAIDKFAAVLRAKLLEARSRVT